MDLHDSEYLLEDGHLQCSSDNILVSYSLQILIADEYGLGSEEHSFEVLNSNDDVNIFAYTGDSGYSGYYVIDVYRLTPDNLEMDYNPFTLKYFNNNVPVVLVKDINYNQTVVGILDTTPPSSLLTGESNLINNENINLTLSLIDDNSDFSYFTVQYLVNEEFAEWENYGSFSEQFIQFKGVKMGMNIGFGPFLQTYMEMLNNQIFEYQVKLILQHLKLFLIVLRKVTTLLVTN